MAKSLSTKCLKTVLFLSLLGVSACQHYCLNYADLQDCDSRVLTLQKQVAKLERENRKLRLYSSNDKCDEITSLDH